jgi:hypothetical protein
MLKELSEVIECRRVWEKKARKLHAARLTILVFHLCISENSIQDRILPNVINLLVKYSIVNVLVALRIQL